MSELDIEFKATDQVNQLGKTRVQLKLSGKPNLSVGSI